MLPKAGPDPKFTLPAIEKTKLSNGLNVWVVKKTRAPDRFDGPRGQCRWLARPERPCGHRLADGIDAHQGTKTRSALDIANGLQSIGANVSAGASWDSSGVSMRTITKNLDKALDYFLGCRKESGIPETGIQASSGAV